LGFRKKCLRGLGRKRETSILFHFRKSLLNLEGRVLREKETFEFDHRANVDTHLLPSYSPHLLRRAKLKSDIEAGEVSPDSTVSMTGLTSSGAKKGRPIKDDPPLPEGFVAVGPPLPKEREKEKNQKRQKMEVKSSVPSDVREYLECWIDGLGKEKIIMRERNQLTFASLLSTVSLRSTASVMALPAISLQIGRWRRVSPLICYHSRKAGCLIWYISSDSVGFKLEVPYTSIISIEFSGPSSPTSAEISEGSSPSDLLGHLSLQLERPPTFFMEVFRSSGPEKGEDNEGRKTKPTWRQCADFTEGRQATNVLFHVVTGPYEELKEKVAEMEDYHKKDPVNRGKISWKCEEDGWGVGRKIIREAPRFGERKDEGNFDSRNEIRQKSSREFRGDGSRESGGKDQVITSYSKREERGASSHIATIPRYSPAPPVRDGLDGLPRSSASKQSSSEVFRSNSAPDPAQNLGDGSHHYAPNRPSIYDHPNPQTSTSHESQFLYTSTPSHGPNRYTSGQHYPTSFYSQQHPSSQFGYGRPGYGSNSSPSTSTASLPTTSTPTSAGQSPYNPNYSLPGYNPVGGSYGSNHGNHGHSHSQTHAPHPSYDNSGLRIHPQQTQTSHHHSLSSHPQPHYHHHPHPSHSHGGQPYPIYDHSQPQPQLRTNQTSHHLPWTSNSPTASSHPHHVFAPIRLHPHGSSVGEVQLRPPQPPTSSSMMVRPAINHSRSEDGLISREGLKVGIPQTARSDLDSSASGSIRSPFSGATSSGLERAFGGNEGTPSAVGSGGEMMVSTSSEGRKIETQSTLQSHSTESHPQSSTLESLPSGDENQLRSETQIPVDTQVETTRQEEAGTSSVGVEVESPEKNQDHVGEKVVDQPPSNNEA